MLGVRCAACLACVGVSAGVAMFGVWGSGKPEHQHSKLFQWCSAIWPGSAHHALDAYVSDQEVRDTALGS